jgi:hypothetical protein
MPGSQMDGVGRVTSGEYRNLAARWRGLASDATTPRLRQHLLDKARECEALASGAGVLARPIESGLSEGSR